MKDPTEVTPSLTEVAVVAGTTRATARKAMEMGAMREGDLTWIDALALRVYATVSSMRFPGEPLHRVPAVALGRAILGAATVRQEADGDRMPVAAQLVVTRDLVRLLPDLANVFLYLDRDLSGSETAQVLPAGRWWYDMRWRMGTRSAGLSDLPPASGA